jgi:hypothetical protein
VGTPLAVTVPVRVGVAVRVGVQVAVLVGDVVWLPGRGLAVALELGP